MSQIVFAALPAARRANHHAGEAGPRALQGDDHDIVQSLAAGQDGDQDFCLRRHLVRCTQGQIVAFSAVMPATAEGLAPGLLAGPVGVADVGDVPGGDDRDGTADMRARHLGGLPADLPGIAFR